MGIGVLYSTNRSSMGVGCDMLLREGVWDRGVKQCYEEEYGNGYAILCYMIKYGNLCVMLCEGEYYGNGV